MFAQRDTEGGLSFNKDRDADKRRLPVNGPWWLNSRGNVSHRTLRAEVTSTPFCDNREGNNTDRRGSIQSLEHLFFLHLKPVVMFKGPT